MHILDTCSTERRRTSDNRGTVSFLAPQHRIQARYLRERGYRNTRQVSKKKPRRDVLDRAAERDEDQYDVDLQYACDSMLSGQVVITWGTPLEEPMCPQQIMSPQL